MTFIAQTIRRTNAGARLKRAMLLFFAPLVGAALIVIALTVIGELSFRQDRVWLFVLAGVAIFGAVYFSVTLKRATAGMLLGIAATLTHLAKILSR